MYNITLFPLHESDGGVMGDGVILEAIPNHGYKFVNWIEGRGILSIDNPYRFIVIESMVLLANFEENGITNIASIDVENIKIYPNPTTGELTVTNYKLRITNIEIFDISGKMQKTERKKQNTEWSLDVSDLTAGVYFIKIETEKGTITKKFVKN
jgi:hypothetical protein